MLYYNLYMRDYNIQELKKNNPQLYVEKTLTYDIRHDWKISKQLVKKYINEIQIPKDINKFIHFLLDPDNEAKYSQ